MSIFLLILKITGIVLLSLIGLVIFVVSLILFVPIRYKLKAEYDGNPYAFVKISYLLHIVTFIFSFNEGNADNKLKIFGINVLGSKKNKKNKKNKTNNKNKESVSEIISESEPEYVLEGFEPDEEDFEIEDPQTEYYTKDDFTEEEIPKGFFGKLKEYLRYIYNFINTITDKIKSVFGKLKDIKENIVYYIDLISDDYTKETIRFAFNIVLKILKAIKPRKICGKVRFGFDDPETTGKLLSILAVLYPFTGGAIEIIPEFENEVMEGNLFLRGRIFIITLLIEGWKLYFNKDIRKVIKDFKREN